jgi:hypothetical protein
MMSLPRFGPLVCITIPPHPGVGKVPVSSVSGLPEALHMVGGANHNDDAPISCLQHAGFDRCSVQLG